MTKKLEKLLKIPLIKISKQVRIPINNHRNLILSLNRSLNLRLSLSQVLNLQVRLNQKTLGKKCLTNKKTIHMCSKALTICCMIRPNRSSMISLRFIWLRWKAPCQRNLTQEDVIQASTFKPIGKLSCLRTASLLRTQGPKTVMILLQRWKLAALP